MWWGWKLIIFTIAVFLFSMVFSPLAAIWGGKTFQRSPTGKAIIKLDPWIFTLVTVGVSLLMVGYLDRRPLPSVGLHLYSSWWQELGLGIAIGCLMLVLSALLFWGLSRHNPFQKPRVSHFAKIHAHLRGAVGEELLSRGYPLQTLIGGIGLYPAVAVTSAFFGLLHYQRLGWMGALGTSLTGLLLAVPILKTNALWMSIGIHLGWNLLEAALMARDLQPTHRRYVAEGIVEGVFLLLLFWLPLHPHPEMERLWREYILRP